MLYEVITFHLRRKEKPGTRMVSCSIWWLLVIPFLIIRLNNVKHFIPIREMTHMLKRSIPLLAALAVAISPVVPSSPALAQDEPKPNQFWWPEKLNLQPLRQHAAESNPIGGDFNYAEAFNGCGRHPVRIPDLHRRFSESVGNGNTRQSLV